MPPPRAAAGRRTGAACLWIILSLSAYNIAHPARATVSFDFEGPVFIEPGAQVKDHSLISIDGIYHLYYIRENGKSFGYATSPDLRHWTLHGPVLSAGPESWDEALMWAPCVIRYPNYPWHYLMYYTGVNSHIAQRTCLALTRMPYLWGKATAPLFVPFHGDTSWIRWNEESWSNYRDPFFYEEDGTFYLLQTAHTKGGLGTIALAWSDDYFTWSDAGPLYVHGSWHALESPYLVKRAGTYHLFFTEETVGGVSHLSSHSLSSGWNILERTIIDDGHAAELTDIGCGRRIFSRHTTYGSPAGIDVSTIRFDTLAWNGDSPVVLMDGHLEEGWTVLWGDAFDHQPVFCNNPLLRGDDTTVVGFEGNWWIGTYESFDGPLMGSHPGSSQGDGARGAIRSRTFTLTGLSMRLLVGGGEYRDSCYVALREARTGTFLFRETGRGTDRMDERFWNTWPYRGWEVYLTIVDDCSAPRGHINVDGIEERQSPAPGVHDGGTPEVPPGKPQRRARDDLTAPGGDGGEPPCVHSIAAVPNPCNPYTDIHFVTTPSCAVSVFVYSPCGAAVRRFAAETDERGTGTVRWDGCDNAGTAVSAGVYFAALRGGGSVTAVCKIVVVR